MPRTGVEPKPPWSAVPPVVRRATEGLLAAEVRRAMRVWGGYSPTPTYRLRLADGRGVFFKGTGPSATDFARPVTSSCRCTRSAAGAGCLSGPRR